jgi:hypothetical protein
VIREQLEPFLARSRFRARRAPHFVEQELRAFCGQGIAPSSNPLFDTYACESAQGDI